MGQTETKVFLAVLVLMACLFFYAWGEAVGVGIGVRRVRSSACLSWCNEFKPGMSHGDYLACLNRCAVWECD